MGRTYGTPNSAHRLIVDKESGLRSGILTPLLHPMDVETRVKLLFNQAVARITRLA